MNIKYLTLAAATVMAAGAALPAMAQTNAMNSNAGAVKTSTMTTGKSKAGVKHVSAKKADKKVSKKSV